MRKLLLSLVCIFGMTGLILAGEVTLVKHDADKKEVTVKDKDDKEMVLKYTDKTKVTFTDKNGENGKEGTLEAAVKMLSKEKALGKLKMDITTDKDTITEIKMRGEKKGKN